MILVDTSAWIHHLRRRDSKLVTFLLEQRVRTCDVVLGELLLGSGLPRGFAADLRALPTLPSPSAAESRAFVERHVRTLAGSGVGWADVEILATAARAGARLHSADRAIQRVSRLLGVPAA